MRNATPSKRKRDFMETSSIATQLLLTPLGNNHTINAMRPSHGCLFRSGDGLAVVAGKASLLQDIFGLHTEQKPSVDIESIDWEDFEPSNIAYTDRRILYSSSDGGVEFILYNDANEVSLLQVQLSLAHEESIVTVALIDEIGVLGSNRNEVYLVWSHDDELFVHQLQPSRGFLNALVTTGSKLLFGSGTLQPSIKKIIPLGTECMVVTSEHVTLWSEYSTPHKESIVARIPLADALRPDYTAYFHCDVTYDILDAAYIHGNLYLLVTVIVNGEKHLWYHHLHYAPQSFSAHYSTPIDSSHSVAQLILTPSILFISYTSTTLHVLSIDLLQPYASQSLNSDVTDTAIDPLRLLCVGHLSAYPASQPTLMILLHDGTRLACSAPLLNPPPLPARIALETPRKSIPTTPANTVKADPKQYIIDLLMSFVLNEIKEDECISALIKHLFNSKLSPSQLQPVLNTTSELLLSDDGIRLPSQRALARQLEQHFRLIHVIEMYQNQAAREVLPADVYRRHNLLAATHILSQAMLERVTQPLASSKIRFADIGHSRLITLIADVISGSELKPLSLPDTLRKIIDALIEATEADSVSCSMLFNMCSIVLAMGKTAYDNVEMLVTDASRQLEHSIFCNKLIYFAMMRLLEHLTVLVQQDRANVATMKKDVEGRRLKELCSLMLQCCDEVVDCKPTCIDIFLSLEYFDIAYQLSVAHSNHMGIMTSVYRSPSLVPTFHQYILEQQNTSLNEFALLWLQTEGMIAEMLELGKYCKEDLDRFIENRPNVAWIAHLQHRDYARAGATAFAAHTHTAPSTASVLLSMSKLCSFVAIDDENFGDICPMLTAADEQLILCKSVKCCEEFEALPGKSEACDVLLSELLSQGQNIPQSDMLRLLTSAAALLSVYDGHDYTARCTSLVKIAVLYDISGWEKIACSAIDDEEAMTATTLYAVIKSTQQLPFKCASIYEVVANKSSGLVPFCSEIADSFEAEVKEKVAAGLFDSIARCVGMASVIM